ncbi:MAG: DUF655 domain-containing protein [Candidatus Hodarchaeales archaeon]|jgi:putative nucleotide binding protein
MKKRENKVKHGRRQPSKKTVKLGRIFVLDFYPQGKSLSRHNWDAYDPLAVVISSDSFDFFDVSLSKGKTVQIGQLVDLSKSKGIVKKIIKIGYNELSDSVIDILPNIIREIVVSHEPRFIRFLNESRPLTTQMHQLQLLPGIGNKRLWQILEARKKKPFANFEDFMERTGISDPQSLFINRIIQEIEGSEKYTLFLKKRID